MKIKIFRILELIAIEIIVVVSTGTLLQLLWPIAITAFPGLVERGLIVAQIDWWTAICLTAVINILINLIRINTNENQKHSDTLE